MRLIRYTSQYKKDFRRLKKSNKDINKLNGIIALLLDEEPLYIHCRDHALIGNWAGYRECHIESDWLLIYSINEVELVLVRTGSHSELF